jgi:hypothetical protein
MAQLPQGEVSCAEQACRILHQVFIGPGETPLQTDGERQSISWILRD